MKIHLDSMIYQNCAERAVSLALAASVRLAPRALLDTLLCTVVYASSAPTGHKTAIPVAEVAVGIARVSRLPA